MSHRAEAKGNFSEVVRQSLTKEMIIEVEETFHMAADSNGVLPLSKLPLALKALGMSVNDLGNSSSIDEEGVVDLDRFIQIVADCILSPNWASSEMTESFALFDKDGNGYLDPKELRRVFTRLGETISETELEDQLREYDIDGDFEVSLVCRLY